MYWIFVYFSKAIFVQWMSSSQMKRYCNQSDLNINNEFCFCYVLLPHVLRKLLLEFGSIAFGRLLSTWKCIQFDVVVSIDRNPVHGDWMMAWRSFIKCVSSVAIKTEWQMSVFIANENAAIGTSLYEIQCCLCFEASVVFHRKGCCYYYYDKII